MENKTKIIATIGPSSCSKEILRDMILAGMNVARLNFSHGSHTDHRRAIKLIRSLSRDLNRPVAVLADLQGPKIRTGLLKNHKSVKLKAGAEFKITNREVEGDDREVSTTYR